MDASTQARVRWFRFTPGRFVLLLLAVEVLLWLSDRFEWFGWRKGYAVLTSVATVGVGMLLMVGWLGVALVFRRRFQFSILTLLVLVIVIAVPYSWLAVEVRAARKQKEAVEEIRKLRGDVDYVYYDVDRTGVRRGPVILRRLLSDEFFDNPAGVTLNEDSQMECLKALPQFPSLELSGDITDAAFHSLDMLPRLEELYIKYNAAVTDKGLAHVAGLHQLQELRFCFTPVTDAGLAHVARLTRLQVLELLDTRVTDAGLQYLEGLLTLQGLSLNADRITDVGIQHVVGLSQLQWLDLDGTQVTDNGLLYIAHMHRLESVSLSDNITDAGLRHLAGLCHLKRLSLSERITDDGLSHLAGLVQLRELSLGEAKVTDEGVAKLQQALPNCKIIR